MICGALTWSGLRVYFSTIARVRASIRVVDTKTVGVAAEFSPGPLSILGSLCDVGGPMVALSYKSEALGRARLETMEKPHGRGSCVPNVSSSVILFVVLTAR